MKFTRVIQSEIYAPNYRKTKHGIYAICALNVAKRSVNFDVKFCESSFKICSLNFKMVYARNLYIDFLAKFALRAVAIAYARSAICEPNLLALKISAFSLL